MEITVTFRHLDSNGQLKKYAIEKVSRIEKFISNVTEVHVILALEKRSHIAEVIVNLNRVQITAKEDKADNMYTAIDLVTAKIEKQVRRRKEKISSHKDQHRKARYNILSAESLSEKDEAKVVQTESVHIKLMTVDEAVMQMESLDDECLVFKNWETEKVNVLYKRRDGDFGLVEPENS